MDTSLIIPTKEVAKTNKEVLSLQERARTLVIKTQSDMSVAADLLEGIKRAKEVITNRRKEITQPIMDALKSVKDLFSPLEDALKSADDLVRSQVKMYVTIVEQKAEAKREKIEARLEKGTLRQDTALQMLSEVEAPEKTTHGVAGKITIRTIQKLEIFDESLLPREYLVPDRLAITKALYAKVEVAGARLVSEKSVAV